MKIYQIEINVRGTDNYMFTDRHLHNNLFKLIQNSHPLSLHDNCTLVYYNTIDEEILKLLYDKIIIEGHDYQETNKLYEEFLGDKWSELPYYDKRLIKKDPPENVSQIFSLHDRVTFHIREHTDTILYGNRSQTGLRVRDALYYEGILNEILNIKSILPLLVGLDTQLDEMISDKLQGDT